VTAVWRLPVAVELRNQFVHQLHVLHVQFGTTTGFSAGRRSLTVGTGRRRRALARRLQFPFLVGGGGGAGGTVVVVVQVPEPSL